MYELLSEALLGLFTGMATGAFACLLVMLLSIAYKYFTNEKMSSFIGIAFGLSLWGFTGGIISIVENPTPGAVLQIIVVTIFAVWGVNAGDKIADRIPKKSIPLFGSLRGGKLAYTTIKLPNARLIYDIASKPRVSAALKTELSEREFVVPSDIPAAEVASRVKRRLITDWGVGDAEIELDQDGKVIHLAVSAKEQGLSALIPEGSVAIPIECTVLPSNLASGDIVRIFLDNNEVLERIELKGVDEAKKVITVVAKSDMLEKIRGKTASLVVALPSAVSPHPPISVEQESGVIEEFQISRIINSLKKVGVTGDSANNIVTKVQAKLGKMEPPVSTRLIKTVVVEELEKEKPEAAKKLKNHRLWK